MTSNSIVDAVRLSEQGLDWEQVLSELRRLGYSKVGAIRATSAVLEMPLSDAKRLVHRSAAWLDRLEPDGALHKELNDALDADVAEPGSSDQWLQRRFRALMATTRTVTLRSGERVSFAKEALDDMARQVAQTFLPMNVEHIDVLPPIGRWVDAEVLPTEDNEFELYLEGALLPTLVPVGLDPDPFGIGRKSQEPIVRVATSPTIRLRRSNFDNDSLSEVLSDAPFDIDVGEAWSDVPPIVWTVSIPVVWAAARFAGAFLDSLGERAGERFLAWLRRSTRLPKDAQRDQILAFDFEVERDVLITAFVMLPQGVVSGDATRAVASLHEVASLAAAQRTDGVLPDLKRAACFFDRDRWRIGWWTDGKNVYVTNWFNEHRPDPERILGRPLWPETRGPSH